VQIQLIAMDIDGTLLDSSSNLPQENIDTIVGAARRGIEIVLVTGRRFDFAQSIADAIPCDVELIVSNGSVIKSKTGETHYKQVLPADTARRILDATQEFRKAAAIVFDRPDSNQVMLEQVSWDDPLRGAYFRRNRAHIGEISPLTAALNGENPIQISFVGPCKLVRAAMATLENLPFADEFTLAITEYLERDLSILDVLHRGVTKGVALAEWATRRGISRENVMAMGDNWNDREMLEYAGLPVVMGNAIVPLKSLGWAVTLTNDACGVAAAIRTYALK
jgi:Cof subfamily protein (haloacid dehalogenase superfamily)